MKTRIIDDTDPENPVYETYTDWSDLDRLGWHNNPTNQVQIVGLKEPGINGLYDIHGNVWEYCLDRKIDNLGTQPVTDPVGAASGNNFICKGGSIFSTDTNANCRIAMRQTKDARNNNCGFRIAIVF